MPDRELVAVVDDDEMVRLSISVLIESLGIAVKCYASGSEFLADPDPDCDCLVVDVRMPGFSGLELQKRLGERGIGIPVIFITGHGDVPMAVRAMRQGALDFLQKPFNDQALLDRVQQALELGRARRREAAQRAEIEARLAQLCRREKEILQLMVAGKLSKVIAMDLAISVRTVEYYRAGIMKKMGAGSIPELVQMVTALSPSSR